MKIHHEKESDGVRVDDEKKKDGVRVHNEKKTDGGDLIMRKVVMG